MKQFLRPAEYIKTGPPLQKNGLLGDQEAKQRHACVDSESGSGGHIESRVMKGILREVLCSQEHTQSFILKIIPPSLWHRVFSTNT